MTHKVEETDDLRVRRTRKLLQEAFIALTIEKGFMQVTVRDITERAMVNRSTFYRHYLDKFDLLDQYMNEVAELTSQDDFEREKIHPTSKEIPSGLLSLIRHIQTFADFYRVMLGQNGNPVVTDRLRKNAQERWRFILTRYPLPTDPEGPPDDFKTNYVACAGIGAITWWLENGQPCTPEQLVHWISGLSTASIGFKRPSADSN